MKINRPTRVPSIPDPTDKNVVEVLNAIKDALDVREKRSGDNQDGFVSYRDLKNFSLITSDQASSGGAGPGTNPVDPPVEPPVDYTTPPAPTGFDVNGGFTAMYLSWDGAPYNNHAYTEIWRNTVDVIGNSVRIGTTVANVYADSAPPSTTYYYWIRFVSKAGVIGPWNSTSGTKGTTAVNVPAIIDALNGEITSSQLHQSLGNRIDLIDGAIELGGSVNNRLNAQANSFKASLTEFKNLVATETQALAETGSMVKATANNAVALVAQLDQAKIGYAAWKVDGSWTDTSVTPNITYTHKANEPFDNNRTILTANDVTAWNLTHTAANDVEKLVWQKGFPLATAIKQVSVKAANGNQATVQEQMEAVYGDGGLRAQYTVKVDTNGYVSGFGLASTTTNGVPTSMFEVRADRFAIAQATSPAWSATTAYIKNATVTKTVSTVDRTYRALIDNTNMDPETKPTVWSDITGVVPFVVQTTATTDVPAGVYINDAYIKNASIVSAKIQNLVADKIATGNLAASIGITTGKISGGASAYGSGTGFWLGADSNVYKFYIGDGSTNWLKWDGSALEVLGKINATSGSFGPNKEITIGQKGISAGTAAWPDTGLTGTGFFLRTDGNFMMGNSTGYRIVWNGTSLVINAGLDAVTGTFNSLYMTGTNPKLYSAGITYQDPTSSTPGDTKGDGFLLAYDSSRSFSTFFVGKKTSFGGAPFDAADKFIAYNNGDFLINGDLIATGNIKSNAVTAFKYAEMTGGTVTGNGAFQDVITYSLTVNAQATVFLLLSTRQGYRNNGSYAYNVLIGSTKVIDGSGGSAVADWVTLTHAWSSLAAGTYTFTIQWKGDTALDLMFGRVLFMVTYR